MRGEKKRGAWTSKPAHPPHPQLFQRWFELACQDNPLDRLSPWLLRPTASRDPRRKAIVSDEQRCFPPPESAPRSSQQVRLRRSSALMVQAMDAY